MKNLQCMLKEIEMEVHWTRHLIGKGSLDSRVMHAMGQVPRYDFLPEDLRHLAYENGPAPIGAGQTISQPYIVALMSDLLNAKPIDTDSGNRHWFWLSSGNSLENSKTSILC